jgi:hypothetical protein
VQDQSLTSVDGSRGASMRFTVLAVMMEASRWAETVVYWLLKEQD